MINIVFYDVILNKNIKNLGVLYFKNLKKHFTPNMYHLEISKLLIILNLLVILVLTAPGCKIKDL